MQDVAAKHDASINEVVLGYLVNQPNATVPIFGARSPEQVEDSVKATDLALAADELTQLRGE